MPLVARTSSVPGTTPSPATIWCDVGGPLIGTVVGFPFRVTVSVPVPPATM